MNHVLFQAGEILTGIPAVYLLLLNAAGLTLMGWDKLMSKTGKRRIPEKWLFLAAIIGGSIGTWLGMQLFHHKTRHAKFLWGIPVIFLLQAAAVFLVLYHFPIQ